jgi:hypothetical protein
MLIATIEKYKLELDQTVFSLCVCLHIPLTSMRLIDGTVSFVLEETNVRIYIVVPRKDRKHQTRWDRKGEEMER